MTTLHAVSNAFRIFFLSVLMLPAMAQVAAATKTVECYCTDKSGARVELGDPFFREVDGGDSVVLRQKDRVGKANVSDAKDGDFHMPGPVLMVCTYFPYSALADNTGLVTKHIGDAPLPWRTGGHRRKSRWPFLALPYLVRRREGTL